MARILITGGAGFIGSHTADALIRQGHSVRAFDALIPQVHGKSGARPAYLHPHVELLQGDIRDEAALKQALEGMEVIFHFAALTGVGQSMYDIRDYVDTNVAGTALLIEALLKRKQPIKRLVLASSRAVYGEGSFECATHGRIYPSGREQPALARGEFALRCPVCRQELRPVPTEEGRPLNPVSIYAWTKKQQEEIVRFASLTYGIPATILRYFNVYGSRQSLTNPYTGIVSIFYQRIRAGLEIPLYELGLPIRDFVHVSDVVRANLLALSYRLPSGATYNVGSGARHGIGDLARALGETARLAVKLTETREYRVGDILACYADLSRSRAELGYWPQMSLEHGLREFACWADAEAPRSSAEPPAEDDRTGLSRFGLMGSAKTS
ncbi:MAG: NAD-dependent epimerase/dehydratase family protein [Oligoflexia bacterium]|nr:NAD-dependent epimerase/dehydratase family protein [Oligoflexia bacterium]